MVNHATALRTQLSRQVVHWTMAASRLGSLETAASQEAWNGLERYLGLALRHNLTGAIDQLRKEAVVLRSQLNAARTTDDLDYVRSRVVHFRRRYMETETLIDFYGDAVNTRTNPNLAALLRACDTMAVRSMVQLLRPLGRPTPPVLSYVDKGLGASILKAGLRLWDPGTQSAVAAIKIVFHNLFRPTALIHETGHQVAHIVGWNAELAEALERRLSSMAPRSVARVWGSWASEIAADTFAFAHTGYAAVAGLSDVLAGDDAFVFRYIEGDPHPISYIRVLLGTEMCTRFFGAGQWNDLAEMWVRSYPLKNADPNVAQLLRQSLPLLPEISELCLRAPMRAFGGRPLVSLLDPARVKPETLMELEVRTGSALYISQHWVWTECLRLLALSGWRAATMPERAAEILKQQEEWMLRLGTTVKAA